jgi:hypothetical protein
MKAGIALVLFFFITTGNLFSQVISFSATADKQRIVIGEPIKLVLEAVIPNNGTIDWPLIDTPAHFEILYTSGIDSSSSFNGLQLRQLITITSWDSGSWNIPPFVLLKAKSKSIPVEVGYSPMDYEQPYHDIKDIMDVPKPEKPEWFWVILLIALLLILFLLFFPRSKEKTMVKKQPGVDPYKKAMQQLSELDIQLEDKKFFTSLVNTFREYLLNRKEIPSYTKTTEDLVIQLKDAGLNQEEYTGLVQVLKLSDLVKFARYNPIPEDKQNSIRIIKENIVRLENKK